jgi:hypothetical protein
MPRKFSEERTRNEMNIPPFADRIDPQFEIACWYLRDHAEEQAKVKIEITACPMLFSGWMATMPSRGMELDVQLAERNSLSISRSIVE